MGFDRAKIYLINKEGESLENVLTYDQRGKEMPDKERTR